MRPPKLVAACLSMLAPTASFAARDLSTVAERSSWERTGRYDEVERLCRDFELEHPGRVRCDTFGTTPEGRPMLALVAGAGALTPRSARAKGRTVVLAQGGIHAAEIDGKDAGFLALRDVLQGKRAPGVLERVTFVFVPVFNVDGHERFGPHHRPNQAGPAESGWRTTAQNLNLNRDFAKLDAPETQALVGLLDAWDPEIFLDLHVTDGAHFRHDVGVMIEPAEFGPLPLREPARALRDEVLARLTSAGHLPVPFYPSFRKDDDPTSGVVRSAFGPRFAHGYWGWRERLGLLVETHSWKDYATRVRATHEILVAVLEAAARNGAAWRAAAREAEALAAASGGSDLVVDVEPAETSSPITFLGVAYDRVPSAISGGLVTRYAPDVAQDWSMPLFDLQPKVTVTLPRGGYVVPAAHADWMAPRLELHGIAFQRLRAHVRVEGESWRASKVTFGSAPFEGRFQPKVEGAWSKDARDFRAGSLVIPIAQPRARLIAMLLEPSAPDSFLQWGFFNASFERKEYMESYVAEREAERMMAEDSALAREFTERLASDAAFAADPGARLDFFYRRHPAWDERVNLHPVMRVDALPGEPETGARGAGSR